MNRRDFLQLVPKTAIAAILGQPPDFDTTAGKYGSEGPETMHFTDAELTTLFLTVKYQLESIRLMNNRIRVLEKRVPGAYIFEQGKESEG